MAKKVKSYVKIQIQAGMANPSPPVGPALGQQGINIPNFCKSFNKETEGLEKGLPVPVIITVYNDRSFDFILKSPPASALLKKMAGLKSGSAKPKTQSVGKLTYQQITEIAKQKVADMTGANLKAMTRSIEGTARSIGIIVEERKTHE